jgi:tetratricopeptide (TPR) repeat protein
MHHLVNLLFHTANTLLLFFVFRRMTGDIWPSSFVAAMFALHPLHVESVTWVSERKDVLSTFFWLLTMWFYAGYVKRPGIKPYLPVLISFAMGLLAKPMLVTLPFVLLLVDYWPLGRFPLYRSNDGVSSETKKSRLFHLILEKIPFFVLAGFSSAATLFAQQKGGVINESPLMIRIANSLVSYISYIGKMIWPYHLAIFYPYPENIPVWHVAGAGLLVISLSIAVVLTGRKLPFLPVGWLWYLGTLVPVIGLVQVGTQAMADRYTYVPLIGLFILAGWGIPNMMATWPYKRIILPISVGLLLIAFIMTSRLQVSYWENSASVFRHALDVTDNNYLAHNSLGNALKHKGSLKEAAVHYSEAIKIKADYAKARNNLGAVLMRQGSLKEAIGQYSFALRITPRNAVMLCNLGVALMRYGSIKEAVFHLREALRIRPDFLEARHYLKKALERQRRLKENNSHYDGGDSLKPSFDAETHKNLGIVLGHQGNIEESIVHFRKALIIKPDYAAAHNYMGVALFRQDNIEEAIDSLQEALRIEPNYREAQVNLKKALASKGKLE